MIIRLMGGLGNQMFQYALYKKLLLDGKDVALDDHDLIRHGNQHNGLELKRTFELDYQKMSRKEYFRYNYWRIEHFIKKRLNLSFQDKYYFEDDFKISLREIEESPYDYWAGYWQNPSYFQDIRDILLSDFTFQIHDANKRTLAIAEEIKENMAVSIHIRRGDYLSEKNRNGICSKKYYERSIEYITGIIRNVKLYLFSDDPHWVKQNFAWLDYTIIDWNTGIYSFYDMYLMSLCKYNIIANSTFSWWGAWLNTYENKIVICPSKWIKDIEIDPTLDEWVKISANGILV